MDEADRIMFLTRDPLAISPFGDGKQLPALTTMLYVVCGNDAIKFEEATRLVKLFVEQALER